MFGEEEFGKSREGKFGELEKEKRIQFDRRDGLSALNRPFESLSKSAH